ncbi:hypothetical protein R1flu_021233 [Riccia fluitans]|uniref:Fucokinase n=1 Tax=Riccia fluitans TaxID=41844 RepID=A0ABD1ZQB6_9MARC
MTEKKTFVSLWESRCKPSGGVTIFVDFVKSPFRCGYIFSSLEDLSRYSGVGKGYCVWKMDPIGSDPMRILSDAWRTLRLSVHPCDRMRTWDAIVLTAASADQAKLYELQMERAKQNGVIAPETIIIAVPDPGGTRIGSGAATLNAIRTLSDHSGLRGGAGAEALLKLHVLLLHTGGDSKRVPWANCIGKAFLPLPFLADEDADSPVPTLFDHILAISAVSLQAFSGEGGLLIMTGDVLPCFDASEFAIPEDGVCVVSVPCSLDLASKHGVILSSFWNEGATPQLRSSFGRKRTLFSVEDLLQKPNAEEMFIRGAVNNAQKVLLDTGIFALQGRAWQNLIGLALMHPNPVGEVLSRRTEISLYEEVAGAWVPARHPWLKNRPLGSKLIDGLSAHKLQCYCSYDMKFLHFGTSGEVLDHLAVNYGGCVGKRHLSSLASASESEVASTAVVLACQVLAGVSIGDESLVFDCSLGKRVRIGARCIVMNIHTNSDEVSDSTLDVPDWHTLWEVPLKGKSKNRLILCCGIDDNPKALYEQGGTFCRTSWNKFMSDREILEEDLWPSSNKQKQDLWNARLFPVAKPGDGICFAKWLMGCVSHDKKQLLSSWRSSHRLSFADLHFEMDYELFHLEVSNHRAWLAAGFAKASVYTGSLERNLAKLLIGISTQGKAGLEVCKHLLAACNRLDQMVPASRVYQAQSDLYKLCGDESAADALEPFIWEAVALETERAVRTQQPGAYPQLWRQSNSVAVESGYVDICSRRHAKVELPVRIDFMGGWSDTPPWSLERIGRVLNMAVTLGGCDSVVGAEVVVKDSLGVSLSDDIGNQAVIEKLSTLSFPHSEDDPFRLIKAALIVLGISANECQKGLEIRTWANVPRGSGLGTSSILAVAVVKGLLTVMGGDLSDKNVANLVLLVEQRMGTGGGWQDQIGGLYPGIKCTTSYPGKPLTLKVEPVELNTDLALQLEQRMVLVFTGQIRLAHKVLEKVVRRYLQRDSRMVLTVKRLAELARIGQETLASGDLDSFGSLLCEAWKLSQELDPECSNASVDNLFRQVAHLSVGYKLVGAGGGGFAIILARSKQTADQIKGMMREVGPPVKVFEWKLYSLP